MEISALGIQAKVSAGAYSTDDAVTVIVFNQNSDTIKRIETLCDRYKTSNFNPDLPQFQFINVHHSMSDTYIQAFLDKINARYQLEFTLAHYRNGAPGVEFKSHYGCISLAHELYSLSRGLIDYEFENIKRLRSQNVLNALQEQYGFGNFEKPGAGVIINFDGKTWHLQSNWSKTISLTDDFKRPAEDIAHELAAFYEAKTAHDQIEKARMNNDHALLSQIIRPVAVDRESKRVTAAFPVRHGNNTIEANDANIINGYRRLNCEIKKTLVLSSTDFNIVNRSLSYDRRSLWDEIGGREIDENLLENTEYCSEAYNNAIKEFGLTSVVEVINQADGETFYVNTEGFDHALYVGRTMEWLSKQTMNIILAELFENAICNRHLTN